MGLQWLVLSYAVAAEAAIALLITLPSPKLLKSRLVSLVSLALQPLMFIVPFSVFQLMGNFPFSLSLNFVLSIWFVFRDCERWFNFLAIVDIYWKNEHRLMCTSDICTAAERDRYEKSVIVSWKMFCSVRILIHEVWWFVEWCWFSTFLVAGWMPEFCGIFLFGLWSLKLVSNVWM